ncbi:Pycsar system effector family protein [Bacteroidota bacterium]
MEENQNILDKAGQFVSELLSEKIPKEYVFHNLEHTLQIVENVREISLILNLSEDDREIVLLAAWFHDIGYIIQVDDHEVESVKTAEEFLHEQNYPPERIEKISGCIKATKIPQSPQNILEDIVCDADLINLGKKTFFERNNLIREEKEFINDKKISANEWLDHSIEFLKTHNFHTEYAKRIYGDKKLANIEKLNKMKLSISSDSDTTKSDESRKLWDRPPDKGVETMFRNNLRGHTELSGLADNKANIMLSINAIIISIVLTTLFPELNTQRELLIPALLLILTCVITIVFATLATRPKVTSGIFNEEDIKKKTANLLFFGNFHSMKQETFEWGMKEMMCDREFLYGSMIRDFYNLGKVLDKKYRYLRLCYNVFMYGLILSILAFLITSIIT